MNQPVPAGLREKKKAKTRLALRQHALRLFAAQGYEHTTVEQIAAAAEVSPSTVFRYFPTKEDLVFQDDYDALLAVAVADQPRGLSPVEAIRSAIRDVFGAAGDSERAQELLRIRLMLSVPELWGRVLGQLTGSLDRLAHVIAQRSGRRGDDFEVRNLAGAIVGVLLACAAGLRNRPDAQFLDLFDRGLDHLQAGFPLPAATGRHRARS